MTNKIDKLKDYFTLYDEKCPITKGKHQDIALSIVFDKVNELIDVVNNL
jgi:hypothetical protein